MTDPAGHGVHDYEDDPRNDTVLVMVNGALTPRAEAVVSVFDAGFVLGDGVWEGLRVHGGHPVFLDRHLDRLFEGQGAGARHRPEPGRPAAGALRHAAGQRDDRRRSTCASW